MLTLQDDDIKIMSNHKIFHKDANTNSHNFLIFF